MRKSKQNVLRLFVLIFHLMMALSASAIAQFRFTNSGDVDYFVHDDGSYRFIYPKEYKHLLPDIKKYNAIFKEIYEKEYQWKFDEKATLVLTSRNSQNANGFATPIPRLNTAFYNGGAEMVNEFSHKSWLYVLLSHETAHLYQLNLKKDYGQKLKNIFGNSLPGGAAFFPPFTYTMYSNAFLPSFFTEGNATFNEVRFGGGGRLYNGEALALAMQLTRDNKIGAVAAFNEHLDFPYGREKYIIGGFFFMELAKKNGASATNYFFNQHAEHEFNPFNIYEPFYRTFGHSYETGFINLIKHFSSLLPEHQSAKEPTLFTSQFHGGITRNQNEILFLTTDGYNLPRARIYNIQNKTWTTQKTNLPVGRLFKNNKGELLAASTEKINNRQNAAGLYYEGFKLDEKTKNQHLYDMLNNEKVWASSVSSFYAPQIFKTDANGRDTKYGFSASSAVLDTSGNVYFFKQDKKNHQLYKNNELVFEYKGYYGFPIEVLGDAYYFIGPTKTGTSIFKWQKGQFARLHTSDTISDAKLINENQAVVAEITSRGYEYKIVDLAATQSSPFEYYFFTEDDKNGDLLSDLKEPNTSENHAPLDEKKYSSIKHLKFDGIDPTLFFGNRVPVSGGLNVRFSDPLQDNSISFSNFADENGGVISQLQYLNQKYTLNWELLARFDQTVKVATDSSQKDELIVTDRYNTWTGVTGLHYDLLARPQWDISSSVRYVFQLEEERFQDVDKIQDETILTEINTTHAVGHPLSMGPFRSFELNLAHEYSNENLDLKTNKDIHDEMNIYGAEISASHDIYYQTFLKAEYQAARSEDLRAVFVDDGNDSFPYTPVTRVYTKTSIPRNVYYEARRASAELRQGFNTRLYFSVFPLSLRRTAVFSQYHEYYVARTKNTEPQTFFHEAGYGVDFDLLLAHKFQLLIRYTSFKSSYDDKISNSVVLGSTASF